MSKKTVFDLDEKMAGLLCYALGFATGIFFYVMERDNKFVRFHALQSTVWFLALCVVRFVLGIFTVLPVVGVLFNFLGGIVMLLCVVSWIYLMYMAYKGAEFKIPVLGDVVWNQINK